MLIRLEKKDIDKVGGLWIDGYPVVLEGGILPGHTIEREKDYIVELPSGFDNKISRDQIVGEARFEHRELEILTPQISHDFARRL